MHTELIGRNKIYFAYNRNSIIIFMIISRAKASSKIHQSIFDENDIQVNIRGFQAQVHTKWTFAV